MFVIAAQCVKSGGVVKLVHPKKQLSIILIAVHDVRSGVDVKLVQL